MTRYLSTILIVTLGAVVVFISGCGGNSIQPYSVDQVLDSFSTITEQRTLDERQDIYTWWSEKISQGSVKHIKDADYYQIEFPGMSGTEVWGIDMNNSRSWPINDNAVLMAFALFCRSGEDPSADCQQWAHQMEAAK